MNADLGSHGKSRPVRREGMTFTEFILDWLDWWFASSPESSTEQSAEEGDDGSHSV